MLRLVKDLLVEGATKAVKAFADVAKSAKDKIRMISDVDCTGR
jgi:hypothetical protein